MNTEPFVMLCLYCDTSCGHEGEPTAWSSPMGTLCDTHYHHYMFFHRKKEIRHLYAMVITPSASMYTVAIPLNHSHMVEETPEVVLVEDVVEEAPAEAVETPEEVPAEESPVEEIAPIDEPVAE